jgi:GH24 family phage-related lysozyme (muramidase)
MTMKTSSAAGIALIERFEGLRLRAYQDGADAMNYAEEGRQTRRSVAQL